MKQFLALALEAHSTVGHLSLALCCPDLAAEVSLSRFAELAFAAFGCAEKHTNQY